MIFNNLNFAGVNSIDYGIYITGEAVYNVPERSVEFVSIAGRDGDLILDNGHFENIEVTYPAGCFGVDQTSFADKVRAFRNAIASKKGYQRLTDSYNPNEYRLATFVNGVEVEPTSYGRAGEFELVFNCKPQRFLMSGEAVIEVTDEEELFNPTPFDSQPIIQVEGYGALAFNNYSITVNNEAFGTISLDQFIQQQQQAIQVDYASQLVKFNSGDTLTAKTPRFTIVLRNGQATAISYPTVMRIDTDIAYDYIQRSRKLADNWYELDWEIDSDITAQVGVGSHYTSTFRITGNATINGSTVSFSQDFDVIFSNVVDTTNGISVWRYYVDIPANNYVSFRSISLSAFSGVSTASLLGHPTVIDCELGEAYKIENNQFISLNAYIDLGSDLPVLSSGTNTVTYDNTITSVKIKPNWWKL